MLLALAPILLACLALALRVPPTRAAAIGLVTLAVAVPLGFPTPPDRLLTALVEWAPTLLEVMLILAGGILLARLLELSGAQSRIAGWLSTVVATPTAAALFVVHGAVPFAESVTGFGVGVMVGVPLLLHLGRAPLRAAVLAMLGLAAVPWGSLAPGTLIAARMNGLDLTELGVASAQVNGVVFLLSGVAAVVLDEPATTWRRVLAGVGSGAMLWAGVFTANDLISTPLAGVLGSLAVICAHVAWSRLRRRARRGGVTRHALPGLALTPYAVLVCGLLATAALPTLPVLPVAVPVAETLGSPALWLGIACVTAAATLPFGAGARARAVGSAARTWCRVGLPTAGFLLLGVAMAVTGMSTALAQAAGGLGRGYLALAPWIGGLGGFVTGSNAGSNSMFAAAQGRTADTLGVSVLLLVAVQNCAASALTMASPSRVEMALGLCPEHERPDRRRVMLTVLAVNAVMLCGLSVLAVLTM